MRWRRWGRWSKVCKRRCISCGHVHCVSGCCGATGGGSCRADTPLGLAVFAAIVGAWLVPFAARATGTPLDDVWAGLAQDRFTIDGLVTHLVSYPLETSGVPAALVAVAVALLTGSVRRGIWRNRPQVQFLLVALAVTYPSVWLAAGAGGATTCRCIPAWPC